MSDIAALQAELARYTYKPGWTLAIEANTGPGMDHYSPGALIIKYTAPDSRNPGQTALIGGRWDIPHYVTDYPGGFGAWLQLTLLEVERHESREWLRRDGELVEDPHSGRLRLPPLRDTVARAREGDQAAKQQLLQQAAATNRAALDRLAGS